jgi:diacylglycerol kinase family enzyme
MLGIPADVIDATEHLLALAVDWRTRPVDLGRVGQRYFLFSAGVGLDASVVERVDAHPRLKARLGEYYYTWVASGTYARRYLVHPPRMEVQLDGRTLPGVTALVQKADPYTYFGRRAVHMGEGASLDSGDLSGIVLRRTSPIDIPTVTWRALTGRIPGHRQIETFTRAHEVRIRSLDDRPLPIQVDGDYIGARHEARFSVVRRGLTVLA